jgi:hypothetical protein
MHLYKKTLFCKVLSKPPDERLHEVQWGMALAGVELRGGM